ncbi:matrixin family metalloprotease [Streptomyces sp. NPDC046385]|uniref:matrixin family metalloprotease n=1 Tax=Streptomyces sp. NPDC046385 TaxID=3154918 RepID=UPI0033D4E7D5
MAFLQAAAALAAATVLALATANAPYAAPRAAAAPCVRGESETRSNSAVDEGEIRWTETSKYDSQRAHAINEWNKLQKINIAPDAVNTVNDLEFRDYSKNNDTAAYYERHGGIAQTDYVHLNKHWLDGAYRNEPAFQKNIVLHELGHALGLCHKADTVDSVMRKAASPKTVPTAVDVANIRKIWG